MSGTAGVTASPLAYSFPTRFHEAFRDELAAFLAVCSGESPPAVSRDDAVLATLVAEAALTSATRETPVKIVNVNNSPDPCDLELVC